MRNDVTEPDTSGGTQLTRLIWFFYQYQAGFYLLVLLVIRGIRTQVAVNHVDNLFDRFLV